MRLLADRILRSKCWWPTHLAESATAGDGDTDDYLFEAFGVNAKKMSTFWRRDLNLDDSDGQWPQFNLLIPGHALSVVYFGDPRYEIEYRHTGQTGVATTWALCGGNFMLPGFRWNEIETFSRLAQVPEDLALLLLLPAADIPHRDRNRARKRILGCFETQGISKPKIERFAADLVDGLTYKSTWHFDPEFGWLTDNAYCWRCRDRVAKGLLIPPDSCFYELKAMTDYLERRGKAGQ